MQSESPKESTLSDSVEIDRSNECEMLSRFFDAVKADQRNVGGTLYASQQANARNYLWVSSVIVSAAAAFFSGSGMSDIVLNRVTVEPVIYGVAILSTAILTACLACAVRAFVFGLSSITGTDRNEHTSSLGESMRVFAAEREAYEAVTGAERRESWTQSEKAEFLTVALRNESEDLSSMIEEAEKRGNLLRKAARSVSGAIFFGLISAMVFSSVL